MKGRFASEGEAGDGVNGEAAGRLSTKTLRPKQCRSLARRRWAEALPEIVDRFVKEAKLGSIAHAKALLMLGGLDKAGTPGEAGAVTRRRRRRPSLADRLMEELKRGSAAGGQREC